MELTGKATRCKHCGLRIIVSTGEHISHCPLCQAPVRVQPGDPLTHVHNTFSHAASKFKGLLSTTSSNIYTMVSTFNSHPSSPGGYQPQQAIHWPSLAPVSSAHGRKRAVLCGVSYYGQKYKLNGCVNDVKCMRYFLIHRLGFPPASIVMLTEEESDPYLIPTKSNMRKALQWLVQGCQPGDSLVFHYSGHASQQLDYNMDEVDGYDEVLLPVDHHTAGIIVDDEINDTIVRPLPRGAKLHAIIDACHSGTILDLPFVCRVNGAGFYVWENQGCLSATYKGTSGGLAVSFSACDDHQVTVDTTALTGDIATGVMTYSFIQAVQNEPGLSYGRLLSAMHQTIRDTKTGFQLNGPVASLLKKVLHPKSSQVPQLSSSETFDIYGRQFVL